MYFLITSSINFFVLKSSITQLNILFLFYKDTYEIGIIIVNFHLQRRKLGQGGAKQHS